jgi:hypothetical protein
LDDVEEKRKMSESTYDEDYDQVSEKSIDYEEFAKFMEVIEDNKSNL